MKTNNRTTTEQINTSDHGFEAKIYTDYITPREERVYRELVEGELWVHLIRFMDKETARGIVKALMKIKDSEVFYKFTKGLLEVER